jgi:hypothetical protein
VLHVLMPPEAPVVGSSVNGFAAWFFVLLPPMFVVWTPSIHMFVLCAPCHAGNHQTSCKSLDPT